MSDPTLTDVLRARRLVGKHLPPTPTWSYPVLNRTVGAEVYVKHENVQPVGAFKVRGGIVLAASLTPDERAAGVVTFSTGNHAQAVAYGSRLFGVECTIVMPENAAEEKAAAVRALGAELVLHGPRFDEAKAYGEQLAARTGRRLVTTTESSFVAGAGTLYLELFESVPDLDTLVVPVGGGSGAAAACLVAAAVAPRCRVVAVQSEAAPAGYESWRAGRCVERPNGSDVDGIATGQGFEVAQRQFRGKLADFLLLGEDEIHAAQALLLTQAHTLAEGAGAAALAGAGRLVRDGVPVGRIGVICTGGNAKASERARLLAAE